MPGASFSFNKDCTEICAQSAPGTWCSVWQSAARLYVTFCDVTTDKLLLTCDWSQLYHPETCRRRHNSFNKQEANTAFFCFCSVSADQQPDFKVPETTAEFTGSQEAMGERKEWKSLRILNSFSTRHSSLAGVSARAHTLIHAIVSVSAERPVLSPMDKKRLEPVESDRVGGAVWDWSCINVLAEGNPAPDTEQST